jgi:hypothetical protein
VTYTTAEPEEVAPVKYWFPLNVKTSTELGTSVIVCPTIDVFAIVAAEFAVEPTPRNTTTLPVLWIRYCVPAIVFASACTAVGGETAAVKLTVFPSGVNAITPMSYLFFSPGEVGDSLRVK